MVSRLATKSMLFSTRRAFTTVPTPEVFFTVQDIASLQHGLYAYARSTDLSLFPHYPHLGDNVLAISSLCHETHTPLGSL